MKAELHDLQDHSSHLNGAIVHDRSQLFALLDSVGDRDPFGCELENENGCVLTLGIGKDVGFVQHSPSTGDIPYLVALATSTCCGHEDVEFLVGDTPTPIPRRFCLPFETVKEIAAYFVETGGRTPSVSWEEI